MILKKTYFSLIFLTLFFHWTSKLHAQEYDRLDESTETIKKKRDLPYYFDDIMVIGGLNRSGLYFSNEFRNLNYGNGFNLGFEGFAPLGNVTFINYGIHYAQRSFFHDNKEVRFRGNYLDIPLYVSYSLPELTTINWRIFLGTQFTYLLSADQLELYNPNSTVNFQFDSERFKRIDFGLNFGLSAEVKDYFFRVRSYIGVNNLDRLDQGSMNTFYMEFGYFLFRKYRK